MKKNGGMIVSRAAELRRVSEYEIAATIRDEIKALQAKGEEKSEQKLV